MNQENEIENQLRLLGMIFVHFSMAGNLTADDLQEYMDSIWGEDE